MVIDGLMRLRLGPDSPPTLGGGAGNGHGASDGPRERREGRRGPGEGRGGRGASRGSPRTPGDPAAALRRRLIARLTELFGPPLWVRDERRWTVPLPPSPRRSAGGDGDAGEKAEGVARQAVLVVDAEREPDGRPMLWLFDSSQGSSVNAVRSFDVRSDAEIESVAAQVLHLLGLG